LAHFLFDFSRFTLSLEFTVEVELRTRDTLQTMPYKPKVITTTSTRNKIFFLSCCLIQIRVIAIAFSGSGHWSLCVKRRGWARPRFTATTVGENKARCTPNNSSNIVFYESEPCGSDDATDFDPITLTAIQPFIAAFSILV
jgi:hypothetical protein